MKSVITLLLAIAVLFLFTSCGDSPTEPDPSGTIEIDVEPSSLEAIAAWNLTGPQNTSGFGEEVLSDMPPGTYAIEWGSIEGCDSPEPSNLTLDGGGSITFLGEYQADEVISEETVVLNENSGVTVAEIDSVQIVFDCENIDDLPFSVGDILVGEDEGGYLRRVSSVETRRSQVVVQTEEATLADVIEEGDFVWSGELQFEPLRSQRNGEIGYLHPAVQFTQERGIGVNLDGVGASLGGGVDFMITGGSFDLQTDLDVDGRYFFGLQEFHALLSGSLD
ncbi:MAG: hypothetical protein QGH30_09725, partial [Candidatus Krumholzibacteria bacterium]|nr:hypothetical protein [Candidatus Krumholzibacteria bacterium]